MGLCTTVFGRRRLSRTGETSARQAGRGYSRERSAGGMALWVGDTDPRVKCEQPRPSYALDVRCCAAVQREELGLGRLLRPLHCLSLSLCHFGNPPPLPPAPTLTLFYLFLCLSVNGFPRLAWMPRHHHLHIHHPFPQLRSFSSWRSELDSYWFFPSCQMDVGKPLLSPLVKIMPWSYSCLNSRRLG